MDIFSGWCKSKRRLEGVTIVVTGCNTGIGKEAVMDFYNRGARVIMACRNTTKAEEAKADIEKSFKSEAPEQKAGSLIVEELDLSRLRSVRNFAARMLANEPAISVLVNNAGVMTCPEGKTEDGFETHMGTNHFGHALLTFLLLPRLKKNAPARVVFVSSIMHTKHNIDLNDMNFEKTKYKPLMAYSWSKAANILFTKALANKLKENHIKNVNTYSLHPGVIRTEIGRHFSQTYMIGATWVFNNVMSWFFKSPKCGAQTTIYCAIDEACANESGLYYSDCAVIPTSAHCQSEEVAAAIWDKTWKTLNLQNYNPFGDSDPIMSLSEKSVS